MDNNLKLLIDRLEAERCLEKNEYKMLIEGFSEEPAAYAASKADRIRQSIYGKDVYIRGLIEVSNICANDCLFIGICVAVCNIVIGLILGSIWGYARKLDWLFTEIYNLFDNIPYTVLRMLLMYILRPSLKTMIFVMCLTGWIGMTKYIRNLILIYRDREFNLASRCLGTPSSKIIAKNILPQLISVVMLQTALAIPDAIGSEVFLTYIGLGLPVEIPSLGNLINEGRKVMLVAEQRYQLLFPVLIVSAITISFYALGNAFADASDPRNHK